MYRTENYIPKNQMKSLLQAGLRWNISGEKKEDITIGIL